ncbi:MAG: carbon-nitrogen hydrolase family protein [Erythrobacter sp.]
MPKIAILQMTSGIEPEANTRAIVAAVKDAKAGGADMLFTPEMCGVLDRNRKRAAPHIVPEAESSSLSAVRDAVKEEGIAVHLGSLALSSERNEKNVNRGFVVAKDGEISARYDKMHMFDVELDTGETWRESAAYQPGEKVVTAQDTPLGTLGLTICYDMRFPALFEALGRKKCDAIAAPAAFTVPTGHAHWHVMLRARAIEASAFVIAAAQVGKHGDGRETYGHSLVVDPWGKVLLDMGGEAPGLGFCDIDLARIAEVRVQLPSLVNRREIPN